MGVPAAVAASVAIRHSQHNLAQAFIRAVQNLARGQTTENIPGNFLTAHQKALRANPQYAAAFERYSRRLAEFGITPGEHEGARYLQLWKEENLRIAKRAFPIRVFLHTVEPWTVDRIMGKTRPAHITEMLEDEHLMCAAAGYRDPFAWEHE